MREVRSVILNYELWGIQILHDVFVWVIDESRSPAVGSCLEVQSVLIKPVHQPHSHSCGYMTMPIRFHSLSRQRQHL